ncbi:MAG: hypothetical protein MUF64_05065 [Polyangiaceae bacterium]|nr:hypothetical protein [Polyangiaceae bacterium]
MTLRDGWDRARLAEDEYTLAAHVQVQPCTFPFTLDHLTRTRAVSEAQAAQLAACHDLDTLERWLDLAITAANAADVFV